MTDLGVFEAIHTARALRRFKPDAVPSELITQILEAAVCAPSGGNTQDWYFVVITESRSTSARRSGLCKGLAERPSIL